MRISIIIHNDFCKIVRAGHKRKAQSRNGTSREIFVILPIFCLDTYVEISYVGFGTYLFCFWKEKCICTNNSLNNKATYRAYRVFIVFTTR